MHASRLHGARTRSPSPEAAIATCSCSASLAGAFDSSPMRPATIHPSRTPGEQRSWSRGKEAPPARGKDRSRGAKDSSPWCQHNSQRWRGGPTSLLAYCMGFIGLLVKHIVRGLDSSSNFLPLHNMQAKGTLNPTM